MRNALTAQPIDWADLGKVAWHYGKPTAILSGGAWWFGISVVAEATASVIMFCALAFIPFAFVHLMTSGR